MTTPPDSAAVTVVKLGGSTLGQHDTSLRDIAAARRDGRQIVVVHGGGATVSDWLQRAGLEPRFVRGLRVTDAAALEIVVAVLAGLVNKQLVADLAALGAPAAGLSGADGLLLQARPHAADLGFVGTIHHVDPRPLRDLLDRGYLPVVAPIAIEAEGAHAQLLNTNADTAAGEIAAALAAERLIFLTDVEGVLDGDRHLLGHLDAAEAAALIASGVASGGMIPKLEAAVRAAVVGCATRIVNGRAEGVLARVLAGGGGGTAVTP
ncbi:MAG TPA: acetylglutamate kinase [Dehalococcoidia bacterium]|nr:acetylglutamate kinase [Dehalococcoidia bacterium]